MPSISEAQLTREVMPRKQIKARWKKNIAMYYTCLIIWLYDLLEMYLGKYLPKMSDNSYLI